MTSKIKIIICILFYPLICIAFTSQLNYRKIYKHQTYPSYYNSKYLPRDLNVLKATLSIPSMKPPLKTIMSKASTILMPMLQKNYLKLFGLALIGTLVKFKTNLMNVGDKMEEGWLKRGKGSAIGRTIEVWSFAISFLFKWVSKILL
jgi:hypothetical protein